MKIIQNFDMFSEYEKGEKQSVVTIGNFDGIHIGHKKLIQTAKEYAQKNGMVSVVMSFSPHPLEVLKNRSFSYILSEDEKNMEMEKEGVDYFLKYPFNKYFAKTSPEEFIAMLKEKIRCKVLIIGEDYSFGKDREGNVSRLKEIGLKYSIDIIVIEDVMIDGERVSSSSIRRLIIEKDMKSVQNMLDKPYFIYGTVVTGNKIGRTIGFPTANIIPISSKMLPPDSVYITKTQYAGCIYESMTNIGSNPTVNNKHKTVETYIFDMDSDIYGKEIKVMFLEWIRGGQKFSSILELKEQIAKDKVFVQEYFRKNRFLGAK